MPTKQPTRTTRRTNSGSKKTSTRRPTQKQKSGTTRSSAKPATPAPHAATSAVADAPDTLASGKKKWNVGTGALTIALGLLTFLVLLAVVGAAYFAYSGKTKSVAQEPGIGQPIGDLPLAQNASIEVPKGAFLRFRATGRIELRNKFRGQCPFVQPATEHVAERLSSGFRVSEIGSGDLIYIMTWSSDGWVTVLDIAKNRTETITVTADPIGERGCKPIRL